MASAGENSPQKSTPNTKADTTSVGGSSSHSAKQKKSHSPMQPAAARQKQDRPTNQQPQRQNHRVPMSSEKRRQQHHHAPSGNFRGNPLATDLFGSQNNPPFRFEFHRGGSQHQFRNAYMPGGNRGGYRGNNKYAQKKNTQEPLEHECQGSSPGSKVKLQQKDGTDSSQNKGSVKNSLKAEQKSAATAQSTCESDRKVQYFEKLMKNGEKSSNLQITVTDQRDGQRDRTDSEKWGEAQERAETSAGKSLLNGVVQKCVAGKFSNPLMGGKTEQADKQKTPEGGSRSPPKSFGQLSKEQDTKSTPENDNEKPEKKRKKRSKKKKKDRNNEDKTSAGKEGGSQQLSQVSNSSVEKLDKTDIVSATPVTKASAVDKPEVKVQSAEKSKGNKESEEGKTKENKESEEGKTSTATEQGSVSKKLEELGLEQAEKRLEKDMIFRLEKQSSSFPEAKYFCKLCSHHLNTVAHAHKHIKDKRHKKESKSRQQDELLRQLKMPPDSALQALDRHLANVLEKNMMTEEDARERRKYVERLDKIISTELKGCNIVTYGSSVTTIGSKSSDVNVDVQYSGDLKTPAVLMTLLDIFKKSDELTDVNEDFDAKVPRIEVKDKSMNYLCSLSVGNVKALHTTRLLRLYSKIEPAVTKLSMLFRFWGHLCEVDKQQDGSLPPHTFTLMAIFYLQQTRRLPVLHEVMADHDIEHLYEKPEDQQMVVKFKGGEWWYYPTAPPADGQSHKVKDEEEDVDEIVIFSESDEDVEMPFSGSPHKNERVFSSNSGSNNKEKSLAPVKLWVCSTTEAPCLAELWLGLLKYYSAQFDMENLVITIRSTERVTRSDRGWSHRRIAVEDPCSPKWNLCKPMNSQLLFSYFLTRLKHCVFYFHTAHNSVHSASKKPSKPDKNSTKKHNTDNSGSDTVDDFVDTLLKSVYDEVRDQSSLSNNRSGQKTANLNKQADNGQLSPSDEKPSKDEASSSLSKGGNNVTDPVSCLVDSMVEDVVNSLAEQKISDDEKVPVQGQINYAPCYKFTKQSLMDGKAPVIVCSVCKKEGHRKKNCPEEVKIKVPPLPPITRRLRQLLDHVCKESYEMYVPKEDEVRMREKVCSDLLDFLQKNYDSNVRMCLFGSSRNRFTFRGSDLDICMTFEGNSTGEDLDYAEVIDSLARILRRDPNLRHIIPITTAKVPIVKFYHPKTGLEGDISLYNLLAQRNTSMLALYASIDDRCRMLGYTMKAFVKRCFIGDASRGSLSSYAYILMVIYFLQQRDPPVLPVLQELYSGSQMPEHIVDGWNSWFYDSIGCLNKVWSEFGKNRESLGDLWLGMVRFYTETFDFSRHVVCIRQKKLLTAFEKEWTSKCICIEDPFDMNHNLGAGVSRKMTNFILKVFVKARERFGSEPKDSDLNGFLNHQHYFFDAEFLMDGQEVPNDRCCRICGKIGHFVKDCPNRRQRKKNGEDTKARDIECFSCGKKGHFKKDCPELKIVRGSPVKGAPFLSLQQPPLHFIIPQRHIMMPFPANVGQGSPVMAQVERKEQMHPRFSDPQSMCQSRQPFHTPQKSEEKSEKQRPDSSRKEGGTPKGPTDDSHSTTPQSGKKRPQNKPTGSASSPRPSPSSTNPPFPASGPNAHPPQSNRRGGRNSRQPVNRNISDNFEPEKSRPKTIEKQPIARPSISDPTLLSRQQGHKSKNKDSPSPGTVYTVSEIESQMLRRAKSNDQQPKAGDNLNHLIPRRSSSNEEMRPSSSPGFHGYARLPTHHQQYGLSPLTPPMFPNQYISQYSTSPQNRENPFHFNHPLDYHQQQRYPGNGGLSRTPPSPIGFNYPGISPHRFYPQYEQRGQRPYPRITFDPSVEPIAGVTFSKSNNGVARREVHFTSPNAPMPHHSYPPDRPQPGHWDTNYEK